MSERITGYVLLVTGLLIILFATFSIIFVFTKRSEPVQLFTYNGISIDSSKLAPQVPGSTMPSEPLEIISGDMINGSANIFAHVAFMGFLLTVGYNIALLGVNLLRPIVVKTSQKSVSLESAS